jgi:hypothetical protein
MTADIHDMVAVDDKVAIRATYRGTDKGGFIPDMPATRKASEMEAIFNCVAPLGGGSRLGGYLGQLMCRRCSWSCRHRDGALASPAAGRSTLMSR